MTLRKIKLYGELAEFVGHKEFDAVVSNTADTIRFLITNFPKLEAHMNQRQYQILVDDYEIGENEIHNPIGKADINIVPVISGAGGNVGKLVLGGALIALSMGAFGAFAGNAVAFGSGAGGFAAASLGAKAAFGIGAGLVLSGVSDMLFPVPDFDEPEDDPRISFSFSGIQNTTRPGTSIPICYGEIVCGSVVISAGIDTHQVSA